MYYKWIKDMNLESVRAVATLVSGSAVFLCLHYAIGLVLFDAIVLAFLASASLCSVIFLLIEIDRVLTQRGDGSKLSLGNKALAMFTSLTLLAIFVGFFWLYRYHFLLGMIETSILLFFSILLVGGAICEITKENAPSCECCSEPKQQQQQQQQPESEHPMLRDGGFRIKAYARGMGLYRYNRGLYED